MLATRGGLMGAPPGNCLPLDMHGRIGLKLGIIEWTFRDLFFLYLWHYRSCLHVISWANDCNFVLYKNITQFVLA